MHPERHRSTAFGPVAGYKERLRPTVFVSVLTRTSHDFRTHHTCDGYVNRVMSTHLTRFPDSPPHPSQRSPNPFLQERLFSIFHVESPHSSPALPATPKSPRRPWCGSASPTLSPSPAQRVRKKSPWPVAPSSERYHAADDGGGGVGVGR